MTNSVIQTSFAAGELSTSLYGRVDLAKFHTGVALARNFFVDYRGGLSTRPGTVFVGQVKDSAAPNRLIPFQFSTVQTYALVFGNYSMRVVMNGAYVTEPSQAIGGITSANPAVVNVNSHGFSSGDLIYFSNISGTTSLSQLFGTAVVIDANHFSMLDMYGNPISTAGEPAFTNSLLTGLTFSKHPKLPGVAQQVASPWNRVSRVYTLTTPYAAADLALLKYSQSADTMTLTHPSYQAQQLTRTQHWAWTIAAKVFVPTNPVPTGVTATASNPSPASTIYNYVVTSVADNGVTESLASSVCTTTGATMSTTPGATVKVSWTGNPGDTLYNIYRQPEVINAGPTPGMLFGYVGSAVPAAANSFIDNNIAPDYTRTPPLANNPFAQGAIQSVPVISHGSGYGAGCTLQVTDSTGTGAVLIPILAGGAITGISVISGGENYTAPVVSILAAAGGTGATFGTPIIAPQNNPGCNTYYQQRQVFAGSSTGPETLVFSRTGDFGNLTYSTPNRSDDSIEATIASQMVNPIKHMVPLTSLIVLTGSGAWRVDGGNQSDAITPQTIFAVPQAYNGCSDVPPLVINYDILYVQAKGSIVRDLSYNFYVNVYTGNDISMLSNHLFYGHQIVEWCWAEEPFKLVWAVREDGVLLSLTYLKEQEIYGWTRHDTKGLFKSICSISEGNENAVYVIVERLVNGQYLQYIERMASRNIGGDPALGIPGDVTQAWCVDAGVQNTQVYPVANLSPSPLWGSSFSALGGNPVVAFVNVIFGGSGYVSPTIIVNDVTGSGAVLTATVVDGVITSITVNQSGAGYTDPTLTISDPSGSGAVLDCVLGDFIYLNADQPVFTAANVGDVIRANGGRGTITSVVSGTQVVVNLDVPLTSAWPAPSGSWSTATPRATFTGLDHLDGQTVAILADGNVMPQQVVTNGSITIPIFASSVIVGLPYTPQIKTLYLDVQAGTGTIQGKRKTINAVTIRTQDTRGISVGPNFTQLREIKDRTNQPMGTAVPLYTGDHRVIVDSQYNVAGQICVEQAYPLPATILAVMPEIQIGDT